MAITLITGTPGAGKTLNTIKMVDEEYRDSERPIYYAGIRELTLPWTEITYDEVREWEKLPDGSIVVVDEADNAFPNRPHNRPTPEFVKELARHRHRGFDFFIITQQPTMLDFALRHHVGRHLHFERNYNFRRARRYEWQRAVDHPQKDDDAKSVAELRRFKHDTKYYDVYKSAELHTMKPRIPRKVLYLLPLFALTIFLGYRVISPDEEEVDMNPINPVPVAMAESRAVPTDNFRFASQSTSSHPFDSQDLEAQMYFTYANTPRIKDVPHSAPIYDEVLQVKTFPRPQCMFAHRRQTCNCYTQQATPLDISYQQCMAIVKGGWFNPYREETRTRARPAETVTTPSAGAQLGIEETGPTVVYVGRDGRQVGAIPETAYQDTNQPGAAYRNPGRTVATQPRFP